MLLRMHSGSKLSAGGGSAKGGKIGRKVYDSALISNFPPRADLPVARQAVNSYQVIQPSIAHSWAYPGIHSGARRFFAPFFTWLFKVTMPSDFLHRAFFVHFFLKPAKGFFYAFTSFEFYLNHNSFILL